MTEDKETTAGADAVSMPEEQQEPIAEETNEEQIEQSAADATVEPVLVDDDVTEGDVSGVAVSKAEEAETETEAEPVAEESATSEAPAIGSPADEPVAEDVESGSDGEIVEADAAADDASGEDATAQEATDDEDADGKKVVRMLAVGQQVEGVVKRITDFGAFVDIGVGRDGLIHVSELSLNRVAKVTDVLSEKQEIQPWIKKLDRSRNRISLTLIDPEQKTIRDLNEDEIVTGTVTRILPYGAFIDIGIGRDALLHVREMSNKFVEKPEDIVSVGETLEARIIELSRRRGRVDLSLKGLRDEPEEEAAVEVVDEEEEWEEIEDEFENVEVLSPMELAFKKAVEAEGGEVKVNKKTGRKKRGKQSSAIQDEIIARTLNSSRK